MVAVVFRADKKTANYNCKIKLGSFAALTADPKPIAKSRLYGWRLTFLPFNFKDRPVWQTVEIETGKHHELTFTGVAISVDCLRIQFLFQRHNFNVTNLLLKALEQ